MFEVMATTVLNNDQNRSIDFRKVSLYFIPLEIRHYNIHKIIQKIHNYTWNYNRLMATSKKVFSLLDIGPLAK